MADKSDLKALQKEENKQLTARKYRIRFVHRRAWSRICLGGYG